MRSLRWPSAQRSAPPSWPTRRSASPRRAGGCGAPPTEAVRFLHRFVTGAGIFLPKVAYMAGPYPVRSRPITLPGRGAAERLATPTGRQPDYGELYGMLVKAGRNVELA